MNLTSGFRTISGITQVWAMAPPPAPTKNSSWYNASRYYIRANLTYESPLMALTRTPFIGRLIEMERIYVNILQIQHINTPYIETGYGFTNRAFSMGIFTGLL